MSFINALLLMAELGSKINNVNLTNVERFNIKSFKRDTNLSFYNNIPVFQHDYIIVNGQKMPVGTILKRPLDIFFQRTTKVNFEFHYAAVLGTACDGQELLIEMTKGKNISIITKQEFLAGRYLEIDIESYFVPKIVISRDQILEKAKRFEFDKYDLLDLNCKVFVEQIIFDIPLPKRKKKLKKFQIHLCSIREGLYELQLYNPDNKNYYDFIKGKLKDVKNDMARLRKSIEKL